ncbi:MAG TPA: hypothetical protein VG273_04445 [Bryobacteraceae bacterium]|jgi:hypothetical protein|nr:hypothetical protein [Bryobacteraceae bacterium]
MRLNHLVSFAGLGAMLAMTSPFLAAQKSQLNAKPEAASEAASEAATTGAAKNWKVPRTIDGQPDFQGVWSNNNATPLQRPKELAGRTTLTDEEVKALKAKAKEFFDTGGDAEFGDSVFEAVYAAVKAGTSGPHKRPEKGFDGATGDYNTAWIAERDWDNRTSLITDPADGHIPPSTPEAQKRMMASMRMNPVPAGPEDRPLSERCITFGSPRTLAGYDSYYQIVQSRNYVAIEMEQMHDARIVPLDGSPHPPANVQNWMGDSRGHWEGDTLVVDTTNYKPNAFMNATSNLHTIERFTRTAEGVLQYQITIDDPMTWTKPWSMMIPLRHTNELMYEYACHEGNIAMMSMLKGARLQEAEAAKSGGAKK